MDNYPPISCYMSTYGRVHCVEESIECFLRQDYPGKKELVILNDFQEQELIFNHPEVVIINSKERIKPLGTKFNKNIEYCSHDVLACFEDDDLSMPFRLRYGVENMKNGIFHSGVAFVNTGANKPWHYSGNWFHSSLIFTRELFEKVGRYPEIDVCTVDVGIMNKFKEAVGNYTQTPNPENLGMVYCWGTHGSYHGSGWGCGVSNLSDLAANAIQQQRNLGKIPTGKIILNPHWKQDYLKKFEEAVYIQKEKQNGKTK